MELYDGLPNGKSEEQTNGTDFEERFDLRPLSDDSLARVLRLESILAVILGTLMHDEASSGQTIREWYGHFMPGEIEIPLPNKDALLSALHPYLTAERSSVLEYMRQNPDINYDY